MQHRKTHRTIWQWVKHLSMDVRNARKALPASACKRLETAIEASEVRHIGELRVCVEASLTPAQLWQGVSSRQRAIELFSQLRVWDTEHNNGVLIYLLLADRKIEVLADRGLMHKLDEADHWEKLVAGLSAHLAQHDMEGGLAHAIEQVGALLHKHFPLQAHQANPNELPNSVVLM